MVARRLTIAAGFLGTALMIPQASAAVIHIAPPEPIVVELGSFFDPQVLDLDGDTVGDFALPSFFSETFLRPLGSNRIVTRSNDPMLLESFFPADLQAGNLIGADPESPLLWADRQLTLNACASGGGKFVCDGNFLGGRDYLGVESDIGGQAHYGWVQIESRERAVYAAIVEWAYESQPGQPIAAGQIPEPSAALLLASAGVLTALRRRRNRMGGTTATRWRHSRDRIGGARRDVVGSGIPPNPNPAYDCESRSKLPPPGINLRALARRHGAGERVSIFCRIRGEPLPASRQAPIGAAAVAHTATRRSESGSCSSGRTCLLCLGLRQNVTTW